MAIFYFPPDIHHLQRLLSLFSRLPDQPIVASFPHFYARPGKFLEKLEGLRPEADKHRSYSIIEPVLGVPLNSRAVSQSNVVTGDLSAFKTDIARFSNMVVPMFWLEYVSKRPDEAGFEELKRFSNYFSVSERSHAGNRRHGRIHRKYPPQDPILDIAWLHHPRPSVANDWILQITQQRSK